MRPDEARQLLGGYATGTLTPHEQKLLFDAALDDQELFEELMREQALKEALAEPGTRRELIEVLKSESPWRDRVRGWLRWPFPVAAAGALAAAALTVVVLVRQAPKSTEIAAVRPVAEVPAARPAQTAPEPAPVARENRTAEKRLAPESKARTALSLRDEDRFVAPLPSAGAAQELKKEYAVRATSGEPGGVPAPAPSRGVKESVPPTPPASAALPPPPAAAAAPPPPEAEARGLLAGAKPARPTQVLDLFYGAANRPATSSDAARGVVGGYPSKTMMSPKARAAAPAAIAPPLGLRYSVATSPGTGTQLIVESNMDATLYLFRRADNGEWLLVTAGGVSLKAHAPATLPAVAVDRNASPPNVIAVLSRMPLTVLAQTGAGLTAAIEMMRRESEPAPPLTDSSGGSTFAVSTSSRPIVVPVNIP